MSGVKFLIAGLGNVGAEYAATRHNIGFDILDELAKNQEARFSLERHAFLAEIKIKGRAVFLIKPTTYMNLSGKAVKFWLQELGISKENLLVVVDDLALDLGKIRIRLKGSDGGHNGLKSITESLQTSEYARLRFGIGNQFPKGRQVDFVLGKWAKEEAEQLPAAIDQACKAIETFIFAGPTNAMTKYNNL